MSAFEMITDSEMDLDLFDADENFEVTVDEDVEAWMAEMLSGPTSYDF